MNLQEIDQAIGDLETRLERLRVLYEHYFMGMERIEPAVARKDVDRRFFMLRKVRIQNTAKRFKLQTLVQRYNTLQQYWTRTCREIEQGTYRRHRLRAERTIAAFDEARSAENTGAENTGAEQETRAARAAGTRRAVEDELASLIESGADPQIELKSAIDDLLKVPGEPRPQTAAPAETAAPAKNLLAKLGTSVPPRARPPTPPPTPPGHSGPPKPKRPPLPPPSIPARGPVPAPRSASPAGATPAGAGPAVAAKPASAAKSATSGRLDDARIRELHSSYAAARRTTGGSDISLEQLRDRLRATEQKLRKQHANRDVDFEVVVKGGRALIKPKLS